MPSRLATAPRYSPLFGFFRFESLKALCKVEKHSRTRLASKFYLCFAESPESQLSFSFKEQT
jgi:hypothetical protein